jgi:outer membrane protein assembly factor BamB
MICSGGTVQAQNITQQRETENPTKEERIENWLDRQDKDGDGRNSRDEALGLMKSVIAESGGEIIDASGIRGGLVVHLGCGDGKLTAELRINDSYVVQGLDTNAKQTDKARKIIQSLGTYGKVTADTFDGVYLPYINNIVNLVVAENPGKVSIDEMIRVLCPNGVALVKQGGQWVKTVKPRPGEIDDWTHFLHGANGNAVAEDSVVASPFHVQWVCGPKFTKSHSAVTAVNVMVSSEGSMFSIVDEGPIGLVGMLPSRWMLVARDAFNGVVLWRRSISEWQPFNNPQRRMVPVDLHRRLVADKDCVYTTLSLFGPTVALKAATGETAMTYQGTELTQEIIHSRGILFLVLGTTPPENVNRRELADHRLLVEKKRIMAVRADTGEVLWTKDNEDTVGVMPMTLAVRDSRVFFQNEKAIICLDSESGRQIWRYSRRSPYLRPGWSAPTLVALEDVVLAADRNFHSDSDTTHGADGEVVVLSVKAGKKLWSGKCSEGDASPVDIFYVNGLAWIGEQLRRKKPDYAHGRDVHTGAAERIYDLTEKWPAMHHHRCYRDKATQKYILAGRTGVEFINLATGKLVRHHWIRGNCKHGIVPCNGLLYVPPHQCACYTESKLNGMWALAPARTSDHGRRATGAPRFQKGPAYNTNPKSQAKNPPSDSWPTYRHDAKRSGYSRTDVPVRVQTVWRTRLAKGLTQPVAADGKLFVASGNEHTVYALDARSGKIEWSHMVGGCVDSPPSICDGLVVFGSADGYVYSLRASDGTLVWRYLAAPEDKRMIAYGRIESVWPVHGSVLVEDGKVYCAAGRTSYLDGGMYFLKLDLKTGEKFLEKNYFSRNTKTGETVPIYKAETGTKIGADRELPGLLPDILSSDKKNIYMRHAVMSRDFEIKDGYETHLFTSMGFLDDTWWERSYWVYGEHFYSGCFLWPYADLVSPGGRMLTFDDQNVYGYKEAHTKMKARLTEARPEQGKTFSVALFPKLLSDREVRKLVPEKQRSKAYRKVRRYSYNWVSTVRLMARAMVLTDEFLFTAGPEVFDEKKTVEYLMTNRTDDADLPDVLENALDSYEGRKGGMLSVTDKADGKVLFECELDSTPVFDGMIAADKKLFISMVDGSVVCLEGK